MSIAQGIIESLEKFAEQLENGESFEVTTVERCGCKPPIGCPVCNRCKRCNGRGFVRTGKTWHSTRKEGAT